jgi:hypothetical protein
VLANTARADDCIAAPNSPSPPGKHWYYRLDWATKRKCWYVGSLGRSVQEAAPSATKGRATHSRSVPARPNQQLQADDPPLSPGEAGPSSPPVKAIAVKPNAASVSATVDEATSSFPEISAPQANTSSETAARGAAPASSAGPESTATDVSTPEASAPQANSLSETGPRAVARESIAGSTESHLGRLSDDVEPTFGVGELTDNAWLPIGSLLYLTALGLAVVGILSFAVPKLFKNETNKMLAGADVTEVAASMALRLGRGRDSNGKCGDLQQADAFVLKEAGCARDSEEPNDGATPTLHDQLNKILAGADVTEVAASMALRLGRGRDSNWESGDLQQAGAFVLKEVGCARDGEEPNDGATPTLHDRPNRMLAGGDVTEVAASMALSLGRGRDNNGESGDLQQADTLVLKETGCARDSAEPNEGATPTLHDQLPHANLTFNEYRQRIDACLSWAQVAGVERVVCLELAQAWLQAALADTEQNKHLQSEQRANKSAQSLGLLTQ